MAVRKIGGLMYSYLGEWKTECGAVKFAEDYKKKPNVGKVHIAHGRNGFWTVWYR